MRRLGIRVLAPLLVGLTGLGVAWLVVRSCRPSAPARPDRGSESAEVEAMPHLQGRSPSGEAAREADSPPEAAVEVARIVGRVLLPDGDPAVGVKVWTAELHGEWGAAVTDADGRFVLERSAGVTPPIVATAPQSGYGVAPGPYLRGGETRDVGTIQLAPGSVIEGQVVDEDGLPHAEASVSLWTEAQPVPAGWSGMWRADKAWSGHETDAEGRFAFSRLPPGSYWVRAHVHDGVGGDRILEHVAAGTTDLRFVIPRPREDAGLSFRVVAVGPDGTAIPRFDADLTEHAWSTGAIGTAEEPAEIWLDEGRPPFRILVYGACDGAGASLGYAPVLLEDVASREEPYVVRLEAPGREVRGRIVWDGPPRAWNVNAYGQLAADGRSVVDQAHVRPTLPDFLIEATSDASGAFTLKGLPPGRVVLFLDSEDERLGRIRGGDPVVETGSDEVVLEIVPTARLHVVVRAPPGEKVDRVSLRVYGWKDAGAWRVQGATLIPGDVPEAIWDSQGLDPEGRYLVVAEGEWGDVSGGRGVLERVAPRDEPYVLVLEPAPLIRGRVVTADDAPVADAPVRLYAAEGGPWRRMLATQGRTAAIAHTDAQGRFVIRAPAAGRWLVSAIAPGLTPLPHPPVIDEDAGEVRVVLRPTLSVVGRISDPTGGATPRLHVTAVPASGDVGLWRHSLTMGGGFFDIPDLAAGAWRVVAWPEDSDLEDDDRYVLSGPVEAGSRDLRLEVRRGGMLEGRVLTKRGLAVRWAQLRLRGPWVNRLGEADENGYFRLGGIPPGRYELRAETPDRHGGEREIVVAPGRTTVDVVVPDR